MAKSGDSIPVCRAEGLPICEPEESSSIEEIIPNRKIEPPQPCRTLICDCIVDHSETQPSEGEEEGEELSLESLTTTVEEELLLEDIKDELEQQRANVDLIGRSLALPRVECPVEDVCLNMQAQLDQLNLSVHPELLALQRNNHLLASQLQQLQLSCKAANLSLKHLRMRLCRDLNAGVLMQRRLDALDSFKRNLEHEQAVCRQRYVHLEREKYEWDAFSVHIRTQNAETERTQKKFVPRHEYGKIKGDSVDLLNRTKLAVKAVYDFLDMRMVKITQQLGLQNRSDRNSDSAIGRKLGSEITAFLYRNDRLFGSV